jgi:hypothetical protein
MNEISDESTGSLYDESIRQLYLILIILAILVLVLFPVVIHPVSAELQYYQEADRERNNPLDPVVRQGDTIYLGKTYDLSLVTGLSYTYAYWKNWKEESMDCSPDKIVDIRYYRTLINNTAVWINPDEFSIGSWYYWDQYECGLTYYDPESGQTLTRDRPFDHENKFVFTIIKPKNAVLQNAQLAIIEPLKGYQTAY